MKREFWRPEVCPELRYPTKVAAAKLQLNVNDVVSEGIRSFAEKVLEDDNLGNLKSDVVEKALKKLKRDKPLKE